MTRAWHCHAREGDGTFVIWQTVCHIAHARSATRAVPDSDRHVRLPGRVNVDRSRRAHRTWGISDGFPSRIFLITTLVGAGSCGQRHKGGGGRQF